MTFLNPDIAVFALRNRGAPRENSFSKAKPIDVKTHQTASSFFETVRTLWSIFKAIRYSLRTYSIRRNFGKQYIFKDAKNMVPTENRAKLLQIRKLIQISRNPIHYLEHADKRERLGLAAQSRDLAFKTVDTGMCRGGVVHFLDQSFASSPREAAEEFRGGMPFDAAVNQAVYEDAALPLPDPSHVELIIKTVRNYPASYEKEWKELGGNYLHLYSAIQGYLAEGHHPSQGGFNKAIEKRLIEKGIQLSDLDLGTMYQASSDLPENAAIGWTSSSYPMAYALLQEVASHFESQDPRRHARTLFAYNFRNLEIEKIVHDQVHSPNIVLNSITSLNPGYYELSFPTLNSQGELKAHHATGLVIGEEGSSCYFLDPNFGIGEFDKADMQKVVQRSFRYYNVAKVGRDEGSVTNVSQVREVTREDMFLTTASESMKLSRGFTVLKIGKTSDPVVP